MTFTRVSKRKAEYEGKQKKPLKKGEKKKRLFCRKLQCINERRETTTKKKSKQNNQKKGRRHGGLYSRLKKNG